MGIKKRKNVGNGGESSNKKMKVDINEQLSTETLKEDVEPNPEEILEEPLPKQKFTRDFKMSSFRKKLKGSDFIPDLRHFLHLTKERPAIILKYIEKGGKPLELVEAMERVDKSQVFHISYLCEALQLVLMEILSSEKNLLEGSVNASRYFLKNHNSIVEKLLKSPNVNHRKCIIKLLTAIVCLDPLLGRQILHSFDGISSAKSMNDLLSHSKQATGDEESVRKCYIHFVLSYIIDGNVMLIRSILEKYSLISALLSGLEFDDHVTVCVVLNTIKKYIIESQHISKTKKVQIFEADNLGHVVKLYNWKGPVYFLKMKYEKKPKNELELLIDTNEQHIVSETAHEFLVLVLTSRKYGVAFRGVPKLNQQKKHNIIQAKVINRLEKPWLCEHKTDLILKVLRTCPELAKGSVKRYTLELNPKRIGSEWSYAAQLMEKVITVLKPDVMKSTLPTFNLTDYAYWIKEVLLLPDALVHLKGTNNLKSPEYSKRIGSVKILLAMFEQYCNYLHVLQQREQEKGNDLKKFKFDILNHIFVHFPTAENILLSLFASIKSQKEKDVNVLEHLEVTLDLLLLICKNCRSFVDRTAAVVDYLQILGPLCESCPDKDYAVRVELKIVKIILLLVPNSLHGNNKNFAHIVQSFTNTFVRGSGPIQKEAGSLLKGIFLQLKHFERSVLEVDLWLEALRYVTPSCHEKLKTVLPKLLMQQGECIKFPAEETDRDKQENIVNLFENIEKGVSAKGYVAKLRLSKLLPLCFQFKTIEQNAQNDEKSSSIKEYIDLVSLLLFHYFPSPHVIQDLCQEYNSVHIDYISNCLNNSQPAKLTKCLIPKYDELHNSLLTNQSNFVSLFGCQTDDPESAVFVIDGKDVVLNKILQNERLVTIYIYQVIFFVARLVEQSNFTEQYSKSCNHFLINFLNILHFLHNEELKSSVAEISDGDEEKSLTCLENTLQYIYCSRTSLLKSFDIFAQSDSQQNFVKFICDVTRQIKHYKIRDFDELLIFYRTKIASMLSANIENRTENISIIHSSVLEALDVFQLTVDNCFECLTTLSRLPAKSFESYFSSRSLSFDVLCFILNRFTSLKSFTIDIDVVVEISKIYLNLLNKTNSEIQLEKLEESLHNFLIILHQAIPNLPKELFTDLFNAKRITRSTVKLACILLDRRDDLNDVMLQQLSIHMTKKEIIYPLLNIFISRNISIDAELLSNVYKEYKSGIVKTIEKPQKAGVIYKENYLVSCYLIQNCMPLSECLDFCKKHLRVDNVEVFQLKVIEQIYTKAIQASADVSESIFINFLNNIIQLFLVAFRKDHLEHIKFKNLAFITAEWIRKYQGKNKYNFEKIINSQVWQHFCKNCLKSGMQPIEVDGQTVEGCNDTNNSFFIKILTLFCGSFYEDATNSSDAGQLFEIIVSHSRFLEILLSQHQSKVKTELVHLLLVLVQKNLEVLNKKHIPVYLGAYQAKLSICDRYILAILQFYEQNGINLSEFRPFIWGDSAVSHYSLKDQEEKVNVQQQEPSIAQVMSLIDRYNSECTLENFPVWRKLNALSQIPRSVFENPNSSAVVFGRNNLERQIEAGSSDFKESYLRLCPKPDDAYDECYDPAFIVPLMSMAFAPEMYSQPVAPVQNGLLAIVFAALSSQDPSMRLAAGSVHLRYRNHFENNRFLDKPLWIQAYDNIQNGLNQLREHWVKHKKNNIPRVPYISGLFLAKNMNLLLDPGHKLYKILTTYIQVKNAFDFLCIPEFNVLFHSPDVDHRIHRNFILEVIRDGVKCGSDLFQLVSTQTFKALLGFYGSSMSTFETNILIISVLNICCKIPASSKLMIENVGVISWLNSVIDKLDFYHYDTINGVIATISSLWYAVKAKEADFQNFDYIQTLIFSLLVKLSPIISGRIPVNGFVRFLNILSKSAGKNQRLLTEDNLNNIIECAKRYFDEHIWYINNIKTNGINGVESASAYCKRLTVLQLDSNCILALLSLRNFVVDWIRH